ncbi:voltage-dependent calcium channel beta subunit-associated regulatory protein isoform X2 [Sceloporus undulatus]|uniref:voltage-dependent calcium channel beta subunit-associated regulatory protein isoform X2 n=1 Tax=Sceloporus undulatus TaxID=8520 RepID=UPI001C4D1110|nr:voltage-dependent calcium channel beta subunit-associated regulatory protein isoform X2 [Sceloporus undulatus]
MSNDLSAWENTTSEGVTTVPSEVNGQDGYVLLLVLLSIFIGGTLVLIFGVLIICRRCCETDRRHSRANDDPEKTNTTYLDDSQPAQEITIKVDDPDDMSSSSYRDAESERFLSSGSATGRRVSFNEAALFEQSKKTQEKGRRYTLTEGDFHHLKNARLSHLPLPPSAALKIVTIHECESNENSLAMTPRRPPAKPSLAIFQSDGAARSPKGAGAGSAIAGEATPPQAQGAVLHFFTRLRRHASLEGASPYFKIKKWKLETSQRAASLDTRGSPKRHQFQRQRAASESMDQEDRDAHQTDIIQYIARTGDVVFRPTAGPLLPAPASPTLSLGRVEPPERTPSPPAEPPALEQPPTPLYHDIWSLRASLEMYASADQGNDRESVRSDGGDSLSSSGGLPSFPSSLADEVEGGEDKPWGKPKQDSVESESGTRKLLQMDSGYASIEAPSGRVGEDQTASEKRFCFTSAGRKATIFESFEGKEPEEEEEEGGAVGGLPPHSPLVWAPYGQLFPTRETLPRRDYSIDEKTDALFNAFVRHDPQFDESPLRAKHRSRTHLRKQWQRTKQYSDPGVRYPPALERHRTPLRRGDSVNYPLEGRYHSTLPRIVSAGDEEVTLPAAESGDKIQVIEEEPPEEAKVVPNPYGDECLEDGQCPRLGDLGTELMDKITGGLEERFYMHLKKPRESPERVMVAVADASPDHSPE